MNFDYPREDVKPLIQLYPVDYDNILSAEIFLGYTALLRQAQNHNKVPSDPRSFHASAALYQSVGKRRRRLDFGLNLDFEWDHSFSEPS